MIQHKRNSLEEFIHVQMEGPGACNGRYSIEGIEGDSPDIVNTTPGSVYSTAILFPMRNKKEFGDEDQQTANEIENDDVVDDSNVLNEDDIEIEDSTTDEIRTLAEDDEQRLVSDEEDLFSLSQRFPNAIGISCCLDSNGSTINSSDVSITISGRYYAKVKKSEYQKVTINIIHDFDAFKTFFDGYADELSKYFGLRDNGVFILGNFSNDSSAIKQLLNGINLDVCKQIAFRGNEIGDPLYNQIGENYRFLKSYKEKLWSTLKLIKDGDYPAASQIDSIISTIKAIERYETFLSYLEDAASICSTGSFGFWVSENFSKEIDLSTIDLNASGRKTIYSPKDYSCLDRIVEYPIDDQSTAALSVWLQLTRSRQEEDRNKVYLKVQLQNVSTPFTEDENSYFSIVTEDVNTCCFFGVEIKVDSNLLCPYQSSNSQADFGDKDIEADELNYLYRSIKDYGIGHMCSVDWHIQDDEKWVKSVFLPTCDSPDVEPIPRDKYSDYVQDESGAIVPLSLLPDTRALEFKTLSSLSGESDEVIYNLLLKFVEEYGKWIETIRSKAQTEPEQIEKANKIIDRCERDFLRMKSNIEKLLTDTGFMRSFRLMNTAMFIQLWHSKNNLPANEYPSADFYFDADDHLFSHAHATWRPFQLAFILLNLDGIVQRDDDPEWNTRNEQVDLVWFPTGGGKTEAYLGIIALTIIHRRKTESHSGGTTAIMRYTLRLLANQQFRRAMRVIMALEQIRMWYPNELGQEEISIGLFVGDNSLPNKASGLLQEAQTWSAFVNGQRKQSKIPLDRCPWCGEPLEFDNRGTESNPEIVFRCQNIDCAFSEKLPVRLCDEDIYKQPPTLLFGTVDKFASLGHKVSTSDIKQDSRRLFGGGALRNIPPSLIIQDELHLLLGPLGSAVGLFENAVDQLCTYPVRVGDQEINVRPKIISSTATTRNTDLQIRALYDRRVNIFPKNGIDYDDSFFAFFKRAEVDGERRFVAKRRYIGVLPTGRTQMTTQMRLVATLFVHRALFEQECHDNLRDKDIEKAMDYYHSVISYFNSLREVGKTDAQFFTEFTKYTRRLLKRVLRYDNMIECKYGYDTSFSKSELTGRLSGSEVNDELSKVEMRWDADKRLPHQNENGEWQKGIVPPDLILATNMISVGIDIDRFNTIIMNSMPRNIAEYIQASSRVARNDLGLVITLHNPFRARDLSHFERFKEFHEKLYYYVEPISITPFSKKSIDRYFPLYLATIIRHKFIELADRADILNDTLIQKIEQYISEYFEKKTRRTQDSALGELLNNILTPELKSNIDGFVNEAMQYWQSLVNGQDTGYKLRYNGAEYVNRNSQKRVQNKNLFVPLDDYSDVNKDNMWRVPMSLRTIEEEAVISIKGSNNGN